MSFLRPGARAFLARWGEALVLAALALLALWLALRSHGRGQELFAAAFLLGTLLLLALARAAILKARLAGSGEAAGVVEVTERRIAYFAPQGGGIADLAALVRVEIAVPRTGSPVWRLHGEEGGVLAIPRDAAGAGALVEALAALAPLDWSGALAAAAGPGPRIVALWERPPSRGEPLASPRGTP